jgi:abhydrolase domain-containing protein 6
MHYWRRAEQRNARARTIFSEARGERPHLETTIENIEVPILLHWGRQDQAVDVSGADTLCNRCATITAHVLSSTGHLPMLERPNEVSAQFLGFCRDWNLSDNPAIDSQ